MIKYEKQLEVSAKYDVVVIGSGPAGVCAAVAAARQGQRTAIIERYGIVGGNLTIGCVGPILGSVAKGTMYDELSRLLLTENGKLHSGCVHDMENAKKVVLDFLLDSGVNIYLQTPVVDTIQSQGVLTGILISTREGLSIIESSRFIDATGDGDIAVSAGAPWEFGRDGDHQLQPVTLMYIIENVDDTRAISCYGEEDNVKLGDERFLDFTARCCRDGRLPENCSSVRLYPTTHRGERLVNTTQVNYINPLKQSEIVKAEMELRHQIDQITEFLRTYVPGYENCNVKTGASTLGVRESRRIIGEYILNVEDLRAGRRFDDVIVHKANFVVDIHNPVGGGQEYGLAEVIKQYDIPYRCLLPLNVENLLLAGRCISGTHEAMASFRVMSICMAMGQAAGTAAALSVKANVSPRLLDVKSLQKELMAKGADLFS